MEFGISYKFYNLPSLNCIMYRHTSVVVFGKEVFYGQGINTSLPGRSHVSNQFLEIQLWLIVIQHGTPMQVINMGETALDEDTFNEYLEEMKEHYTADKVSRIWIIINKLNR